MYAFIFLGIPGGWELLVIILVVLLIFGGRKIPELMRGLGQGMKEFKNATREEDKDKNKNKNEETTNNS